MKDELFQQLAASLKEGGAILCGDSEPRAERQPFFFEQRAARGKTEDLAEILANVPDAPPASGDERE
jgi:hypothetical protein